MAQPAANSSPAPTSVSYRTGELASVTCLVAGEASGAFGLFIAFASEPMPPPDPQPEGGPSGESLGDVLRRAWRWLDGDSNGPGHVARPRFSLGFVDAQGYLQPVNDDWNPWYESHYELHLREAEAKRERKRDLRRHRVPPGLNPHSWKLMVGRTYQACLIRHPNPAYARALTRHLNGEPAGHSYRFEGDPARLLVPLSLRVGEGGEFVVDLPETSDKYHPHGGYGGWLLYHGMPHGNLPAVRDQVAQLQEDLGRLRYPTGDNDTPYRADPPGTPGRGVFDLQLAAAVHQFQLDVADGKAFELAAAARSFVGNGPVAPAAARAHAPRGASPRRTEEVPLPLRSWAYLIGRPLGPGVKVAGEHGITSATIEPGVVDLATTRSLQHWLRTHLRKPGDILIQTPARRDTDRWFIWGRPQLVFAIHLWRKLCDVFDCVEGISFGHTFRRVAAKGGVGVAEFSIHKTGLAVDLAVKGAAARGARRGDGEPIFDYAHPQPDWPIRFECHWTLSHSTAVEEATRRLDRATRKRERAQRELDAAERALTEAQDDRRATAPARRRLLERRVERQRDTVAALREAENQAKADLQADEATAEVANAHYRLHWRLYGHSRWDPWSARDLKGELLDRLGASLSPRSGLEREFREELAATFPDDLGAFLVVADQDQDDTADAVLDALPNVHKAVQLLEACESEDIIARFFRRSVSQFQVNPYESDGGSVGPEILATADEEPRFDYVDAAAQQPTTKLVGTKSFVNLTNLAFLCGLRRIKANRAGWRDPRTDLDLRRTPTDDGAVRVDRATFGSLVGLVSQLHRAGEDHARTELVVTCKGKERKLFVSDIDVPFMHAWAATLASQPLDLHASGTDLRVQLPAGKEPACMLLRSDAYHARRFLLVDVGAALTIAPAPEAPLTGAECADLIEQAASVLASRDTSASGRSGARRSSGKQNTRWSLCIRPVFDAAESAHAAQRPLVLPEGARFDLPTPGVPRALEWWHFEHEDSGSATWRDLVCRIGLSSELLLAPAVPPVGDKPRTWNGLGMGFSPTEANKRKPGWWEKEDDELPENHPPASAVPGWSP